MNADVLPIPCTPVGPARTDSLTSVDVLSPSLAAVPSGAAFQQPAPPARAAVLPSVQVQRLPLRQEALLQQQQAPQQAQQQALQRVWAPKQAAADSAMELATVAAAFTKAGAQEPASPNLSGGLADTKLEPAAQWAPWLQLLRQPGVQLPPAPCAIGHEPAAAAPAAAPGADGDWTMSYVAFTADDVPLGEGGGVARAQSATAAVLPAAAASLPAAAASRLASSAGMAAACQGGCAMAVQRHAPAQQPLQDWQMAAVALLPLANSPPDSGPGAWQAEACMPMLLKQQPSVDVPMDGPCHHSSCADLSGSGPFALQAEGPPPRAVSDALLHWPPHTQGSPAAAAALVLNSSVSCERNVAAACWDPWPLAAVPAAAAAAAGPAVSPTAAGGSGSVARHQPLWHDLTSSAGMELPGAWCLVWDGAVRAGRALRRWEFGRALRVAGSRWLACLPRQTSILLPPARLGTRRPHPCAPHVIAMHTRRSAARATPAASQWQQHGD